MAFSFAPLIGIGRVVHEQNQQRDAFEMQQAHMAEQDKMLTHHAMVQRYGDMAKDPNVLPDIQAIAGRAYVDLGSRSYREVKPKEYQAYDQQMQDVALNYRKQQLQRTLGIQGAAEGLGQAAQGMQHPETDESSKDFPSFLSDAQSHGLSLASQYLQNIVRSQPQYQPGQEPSSSPYYTPEEVTARNISQYQQQQEAQQPYQYHTIAPGGTLVRGTTPVYTAPQRFNQNRYNLDQAYALYGQKNGLTPEQVEADPFAAAQARQEWSDTVAKTMYRSGGTWKQNPDITGPPFIFEPTPTVAVRGGKVVGQVSGGSTGGAGRGTTLSPSVIPRRGGSSAVPLGGGAPTASRSDAVPLGGGAPTAAPSVAVPLGGERPTPKDYVGGDLDLSYLRNQQAFDALPEQIKGTVQLIGEYKVPPPTLTGMGQSMRTRVSILNAVQKAYPGWSTAQYNNRYKLLQDLTSGKRSQTLQSLNMLVQHAAQFDTAMDQLHSYGYTTANALVNLWRGEAGDTPAGKSLAAAREALKAINGETATVFKPSGATDVEIKNWADGISQNMARGARKSALGQLIGLLDSRLNSTEGVWRRTFGNEPHFGFIDPETQDIISSWQANPEYGIHMTQHKGAGGGGGAATTKPPTSGVPNRYQSMTVEQLLQERARQAQSQ